MKKLPANIELLFATDQDVAGMRPIKVLDVMEGMTKNFHPEGLFSTDIFGKVGGEFRNRLYSYIDLRVPVIHPNLYKVICRMKELYEQIMQGKAFAVFNPETNDFEKSNIMLGETGYEFFVKHLPKLKLETRDSISRESGIKMIEKYKNNMFITKLIVIPAGLRDYTYDETGKPTEDEINDLYRKVMKTSFSLVSINVKENLSDIDNIRANLQNQIVAIYDHIINMLKGKQGVIQRHWTTRSIYNSTRNVITSHIPEIRYLGDPKSVNLNQSVIGLYQFLRAFIPLCVKEVREKFSQNVFLGQNAPVVLINKKTLKREQVQVDSKFYDSWLTYDGIEKIFASYGDVSLRHKTLEINNYYMGLVYRGNGTFKMIFDIDDVPEHLKENADVKPITLTEMLYICAYKVAKTACGFMTRYPVANYGSIYPSFVYLRSTINTEVRKELDDNWEPIDDLASEFPIRGDKFFESMSLAAKNMQAANADQTC